MTEPSFKTLHPNKLTVCSYGGFAPVCYKVKEWDKGKEQETLGGLDIDFLIVFAQFHWLQVETIERPFDGLWTLPGENVCDVAGAGIMKRDNRPVGSGGSWSAPYFQVQRSYLVRTDDQGAFNNPTKPTGKKIVVTRGSTAEIDARARYPGCTIEYVDVVAKGQKDPQAYVVTIVLNGAADAFGEGDISNDYLCRTYGEGELAVADVHPIAGPPETFNFITRNASTGLLATLNDFISNNPEAYNP
jgi:ABC-type amino acid transport substrate-binding protein